MTYLEIIEAQQKHLDRMEQENAVLRKALNWYADRAHWHSEMWKEDPLVGIAHPPHKADQEQALIDSVALAIADAVEAEKAKARIVMHSYDIEDAASEWSTFAPDRIAQHFYEGALWLRTHAKIVWGEK